MEKVIEKYGACPHDALSLGKETSMQDIIPQHDQPNDGIFISTKEGLPIQTWGQKCLPGWAVSEPQPGG